MLVAAGGSPKLNLGVNLLPEGLEGVFRQKKKKAELFPLDAVLAEGASGRWSVPCPPGWRVHGASFTIASQGAQVFSCLTVCVCCQFSSVAQSVPLFASP